MSLDIDLVMNDELAVLSSGIFVRENGATKEITEQEWRERYPDRDPVRHIPLESDSHIVFSANITHNLNEMAKEVGIYKELWRPEELGFTKAGELIDRLDIGLFLLRNEPERYKAFNPDNGWGDYEELVEFVENYLVACRRYPEAEIRVSR